MLTLADNPQETLTGKLWENWKNLGYTERPNNLTYIEVNNLTRHFLKLCREKNLDYPTFDFQNIIDRTLNYYENQSAIENALDTSYSESEAEAYAEYMKQFEEEKQTAEQLTDRNMQLEKQNKKLKAKETETLTAQQISQQQAAILNKLEQLPNLSGQIEALKSTKNFADLGAVLSPVVKTRTLTNDGDPRKTSHYTFHGRGPEYCAHCGVKLDANIVKCWNCGAPIKEPEPPKEEKSQPVKKRKNPLDIFAGVCISVIWLATSGWAITTFGITWASIIGIAVFWIIYAIVLAIFTGDLIE